LADITTDNFEALSLDNNVNNYTAPPAVTSSQYSRSKSNLDQVYVSRLTKQQENRENIVSNGNKNKVQQQQPQQPQPVTQPQQTLSTPRFYLAETEQLQRCPRKRTQKQQYYKTQRFRS
jgi:hypothetical protein